MLDEVFTLLHVYNKITCHGYTYIMFYDDRSGDIRNSDDESLTLNGFGNLAEAKDELAELITEAVVQE